MNSVFSECLVCISLYVYLNLHPSPQVFKKLVCSFETINYHIRSRLIVLSTYYSINSLTLVSALVFNIYYIFQFGLLKLIVTPQ